MLRMVRRDRRIAGGFLLLWLVSETVVFQPNIYDNNKLLFAWFFCLCALTAKLLGVLHHKLSHRIGRAPQARVAALSLLGFITSSLGLLIFLTVFTHVSGNSVELPAFGIFTELFLLAFLIYLSVQLLKTEDAPENDGLAYLLLVLSSGLSLYLLYRLIHESSNRTLSLSLPLALLLGVAGLGIDLVFLSLYRSARNGSAKVCSLYASHALLSFLLGFSLFISGPMTILREWRSSYMMFSNADIEAASYIRENTDPDGLFLTDYSWHLNAVSVLTGRSIVCGPDLFLYYHGIDTGERRQDIDAMFEAPTDNEDLFEEYGIRYVYIGSSERSNFVIDMDYFEANGTLLYDQNGIQVYELK